MVRGPGGTLRFEGAGYGADLSFFLIDNTPGQGPEVHRHPYAEVFIVRDVTALFTLGTDTIQASAATS